MLRHNCDGCASWIRSILCCVFTHFSLIHFWSPVLFRFTPFASSTRLEPIWLSRSIFWFPFRVAKFLYTEHSNHISNFTTTVQKRREQSVAKISTIPPPLRGTTTKWLIFDYYEIVNQIDETGASSAETTKTPLNTSVPESTVVVAEYVQIRWESVNVILITYIALCIDRKKMHSDW